MDQPESAKTKAFFDGFTPQKSEFKTEKPTLSYAALKHELSTLPMTWYPALLLWMAQCAYQKRAFQKNGASNLLKHLEDQLPL